MFRSLKSKISSVYFVLVFLVLTIGCLSVGNIIAIQVSINNIMTANYRSIQLSQNLLSVLSVQNQLVVTFVSNGSQKSAGDFYAYEESFEQNVVEEEHNISQPGEQALVNAVKSGYANFEDSFANVQSLRKAEGSIAALTYYEANGSLTYRKIQQDLIKISLLNQSGLENSQAMTSNQATWAIYLLMVTTLLVAAGGFFLSRYFSNRFLRPFQELTNKISEMKAGMWDIKLDIRTNDEIGRLAREFNNMTSRLALFEQSTKGNLLREKMQSVAIVRSISDPLLVLDNHFRILLTNSASEEFFGLTEREAVNRHFMECVRNEELYNIVLACAEGKSGKTKKIVRLPQGAKQLYFNVVVVPTQKTDKAEYILWMQNITDFKELERIKNEFIATISHELKTPLTSIVMGASMLENNRMGRLTNDQNEVLSTIAEYANQMSELVGRMLELARVESGKAVYHMAPCSVAGVIRASCGYYEKKAKLQQISLSIQTEEGMPPVYGDTEKLTWVLNNLLSNAFKYTAAGGTVEVNARMAGPFAEVSVTDDGEGIPAEFIDRVFDEYVQAPAKDLEIRGSGLGLYAAKSIVEEHKGRICAESTPGKGSRFTFTVPFNWEGAN